MGFFSRLFGSGDSTKRQPTTSPKNSGDTSPSCEAGGREALLKYYRDLRNGAPGKPDFEAQSLSRELDFDTLDLAEVILALSLDAGIESEAIQSSIRNAPAQLPREEPVDDHGGWSSLANLFGRVEHLATGAPTDAVSRALIFRAGLCGPPDEVGPFHESVTVSLAVKYLKSIGL